MTNLVSLRIVVYGQVQGVFFRNFTVKHAISLGITGYVRNLPDDTVVEVIAEGESGKLENLVGYLKVGPPGARVEKVETNGVEYTGSYPDFRVRR
jgi:acylphosphatase